MVSWSVRWCQGVSDGVGSVRWCQGVSDGVREYHMVSGSVRLCQGMSDGLRDNDLTKTCWSSFTFLSVLRTTNQICLLKIDANAHAHINCHRSRIASTKATKLTKQGGICEIVAIADFVLNTLLINRSGLLVIRG